MMACCSGTPFLFAPHAFPLVQSMLASVLHVPAACQTHTNLMPLFLLFLLLAALISKLLTLPDYLSLNMPLLSHPCISQYCQSLLTQEYITSYILAREILCTYSGNPQKLCSIWSPRPLSCPQA